MFGILEMTERPFASRAIALIGIAVFDRAGDRLLHEIGRTIFMLQIVLDSDTTGNESHRYRRQGVFRMNGNASSRRTLECLSGTTP